MPSAKTEKTPAYDGDVISEVFRSDFRQRCERARLNILVSAYACEPGGGSEPGIGWNWVRQFARWHDVFVITRANNRDGIERALRSEQLTNIHPLYFDFPRWARFWKRGHRGIHLYYYLWQIGSYLAARRLLRTTPIDIAHHITMGMYWKPSVLALLRVPFVWGPVGGGESCPKGFRWYFGARGALFEIVRSAAQAIGRLDPFVRLTARRAAYALATTPQTEQRLYELGCGPVMTLAQMALPESEIELLSRIPVRSAGPFRILSLGRLVHWKGFELAIRALAEFRRSGGNGEYWIVGDGPARRRLAHLARELGVEDAVAFWGWVNRNETLNKLAECDILAHPSLHDSGGWVCIEAMAAARPVICLDRGGPALAVSPETGIKIPANSPDQVIHDLAQALALLANDRDRLHSMAHAARLRAAQSFTWDAKGELGADLLEALVRPSL